MHSTWRLALALLVLGSSGAQAGGAGETPLARFPVVGALPDQFTETQRGFLVFGAMLAQVALFPDSLDLKTLKATLCRNDQVVAAFLPNGVAAYELFRTGAQRAGFRLVQEQTDTSALDNEIRAFHFRQGTINVVGLWGEGISGPRSTLMTCELNPELLKR